MFAETVAEIIVDEGRFTEEFLIEATVWASFPDMIFESVRQIKTEQTETEQYEEYEIVTRRGSKFRVKVNYFLTANQEESFDRKSVQCEMKNFPAGKEFYDTVDKELWTCFVMFLDSEGKTLQTNAEGIAAIEVIKAVTDTVKLSILKFGLDKIGLIGMRASSLEPKRINLYKKLVEKFFPEATILIDDITEKEANLTLILAKT